MLGISFAEFFVIVIVAVVFIPERYWPDVARALARVVKFVRAIIWQITDAAENIKNQIELEKPIDDVIQTTTDEILDAFSVKRKTRGRPRKNK